MSKTIAYLVNQYPMVSLSFIRREIRALEKKGFIVYRFACRKWSAEVVDPEDLVEKQKTCVLLSSPVVDFLACFFAVLFHAPRRCLKTLFYTISLGWASDKGVGVHLAYFLEACVFYRKVKTINAAHIHVHFATNSAMVAMLAHELGSPPYSLTVHGPEEFDRAGYIALGEKIRRAKFVVGISEFTRSQLFRWSHHEYWEKIHVIHCGLDDTFLHREATPIPDNTKEIRILAVGRLCEQKGHLLLLDAMKDLVCENPNVKLVIVGDGVLRSEMEKNILEYGLTDHVQLTGWISQQGIIKQIENSHFIVQPSLAEGLPVVLMEAMCLGRPVVASNINGIPELVDDEKNGWLTVSGSALSLKEVLAKACGVTREKLSCMGETGRLKVSERFDITKETDKLAKLFNS